MVLVQSKRTRAAHALMTCGLLAAGCQSYEARPLDLPAHRAAWLERSPESEPVVEFARKLSEPDGAVDRFDPSDGISLAEAEVIALVFNADLRLARARADVAAATAEYADLWEDPVFSIDVLRITESVSDPWVISPGLGFTIPISGRLEAEKDRADAALMAELYAIAEAEWTVRATVRQAWIDWSAAQLRRDETSGLEQRLESLVASTMRLAEAGELSRTEATLFAIEMAQRRNELYRLRQDVRDRERRILALLGLAPDAPVDFEPSITAPSDAVGTAPTVDDNPTLARLRQEYEVAEHTLNREIRKQYPDLTIGPSYEYDEGQSKVGLLGAIPIPILNANKQGIAEAEAERELARAAFETAFERLAGELATAEDRVASLREQRDDIETVLVPLVDRQIDDARQLLQIGEGSGLVMLESLVRAHETKLTLIEVRRDESRARTDLIRLIGPPESDPMSDADREGAS
jgi:outer membrane protein TolC